MLSAGARRRDPGGPDLERHLFWRGQLLASRDLNDSVDGEAERLAWHSRALHDAYGVVLGLAVSRAAASEPPGVTVQPGFAYDAYGREIAVLEPTRVPPPRGLDPAGSDELWALLLASPAAGSCGCGCDTEAGPGELSWRRARRVGIEDGVVLALGRWHLGDSPSGTDQESPALVFDPEPDFRPLTARPLARPRLGRGETPRGRTAWQPWSQVMGPPAVVGSGHLEIAARGIQVTVDTSAAGFTRVPCYFAWLQGGTWQIPQRLALTLPLDRITAASRDRFTFSLWDPATSGPGFTSVGFFSQAPVPELLALARLRLYVGWLGIQRDLPAHQFKPPRLNRER